MLHHFADEKTSFRLNWLLQPTALNFKMNLCDRRERKNVLQKDNDLVFIGDQIIKDFFPQQKICFYFFLVNNFLTRTRKKLNSHESCQEEIGVNIKVRKFVGGIV